MHHRRRLHYILGIIFFSISPFIYVCFVTKLYSHPTTQQSQRCAISICTPCQNLSPDENRDFLETFQNGGFYFSQYKTFPPPKATKMEDLPTSGAYRIETILHQKWNTKMIPIQFRKYIKSFGNSHPLWQYIFWTDQSTRRFIQDHYPNLLALYDNYVNPLNRADSMRYMILFHYGGVYSDLDIQCLHPLDPMLNKYSCFLAQEPHVHSIVYTNFYEQASTALMACRKRHPFMKSVIENLYTFSYFAIEHDSTGPRFLTYSFRKYSSEKGEIDITDDDYVYLAPPEYFNPTIDPEINNILAMQCAGNHCLSALRKWQCEQWIIEGIRSEPYRFSLTNHVWAHIAYNDIKSLTYFDIFDIYPAASIYREFKHESTKYS